MNDNPAKIFHDNYLSVNTLYILLINIINNIFKGSNNYWDIFFSLYKIEMKLNKVKT